MGRSGYSDDLEQGPLNIYRANVERSLAGKRGQTFLREMLAALDAMPVKELIAGEIVRSNDQVCAMGAVAVARKLDVSELDVSDAHSVGETFGIAECMAAEIAYVNDDGMIWSAKSEEPAERWKRVREWVSKQINGPGGQ